MTAMAAGLALFLVLISEYNYYFYCVVIAGITLAWAALRRRLLPARAYILASLSFALVVLITSGPLVIKLMRMNARDPLVGGHDAKAHSMDLLAPLIPGHTSRHAAVGQAYRDQLPEDSLLRNDVFLGLTVAVLSVYGWLSGASLLTQVVGHLRLGLQGGQTCLLGK
jgi:hypothetical protein